MIQIISAREHAHYYTIASKTQGFIKCLYIFTCVNLLACMALLICSVCVLVKEPPPGACLKLRPLPRKSRKLV